MVYKEDYDNLKISAGIIDYYVNVDDKEEVRNLIQTMRNILNEIEEQVELNK